MPQHAQYPFPFPNCNFISLTTYARRAHDWRKKVNDQNDVDRAWAYVYGFDVPAMNADLRDGWSTLIRSMDGDDFKRAVALSRERPLAQLHMRPSLEAFRAYAANRPVKSNVRMFAGHNHGDVCDKETAAEWLRLCRDILSGNIGPA